MVVAEAVEAIGAACKLAPAQVALAWTLSRPGVTAPIFGATHPDHVDAAVATLRIALDDGALQAITKGVPAASRSRPDLARTLHNLS
jgi:1-deoxyxylulose-5-phosphate synthase